MNTRMLAAASALAAFLVLAGCSGSARSAGNANPQVPASMTTAPTVTAPAVTSPASDTSELAAVDNDLTGVDAATAQTDTDTSAADSAQAQNDVP